MSPKRSLTPVPLLAMPLLAMLGACNVGDEYQRPAMPAPQSWKYSDQTEAAQFPNPDWWRNFNSAPLGDLINESLKTNPDIEAAIDNVRAADAEVREAGAALLPQISGNLGATHAQQPARAGGPTTIGDTYTAAVSASYEIDFWGKLQAGEEAASAFAAGSRYAEEVTRLTVSSSVATTYFTILAANDRVKAAEQSLSDAQKLLAAYQKRLAQGTASALDIATQENAIAAAQAAIPPLKETLQQNCDALAILVGRLPETVNADTLMVPEGVDGLAIPVVGAGLPSKLLERRPDVLEAEQNLIESNANITIARANFFPDIELTGEYGVESAAMKSLFEPASILYSIGGSATQTIFDGGALEGALDYQKAVYDQLVQSYRKTVLSAFGDVEDALSAVANTTENERAQKAALATAQTTYNLTAAELKEGIVDITSVLTAERTLFADRDLYLQARLAHLLAIVQLYNALGGGWQDGPGIPQTTDSGSPAPAPSSTRQAK